MSRKSGSKMRGFHEQISFKSRVCPPALAYVQATPLDHPKYLQLVHLVHIALAKLRITSMSLRRLSHKALDNYRPPYRPAYHYHERGWSKEGDRRDASSAKGRCGAVVGTSSEIWHFLFSYLHSALPPPPPRRPSSGSRGCAGSTSAGATENSCNL